MRTGYDIDGVLIRKDRAILYRPEPHDIIITGRSYQSATRTYQELRELDCNCAVYFNPVFSKDVTLQNAMEWKAKIIGMLGIEQFFEDDIAQIDFIRQLHPNVLLHHVK